MRGLRGIDLDRLERQLPETDENVKAVVERELQREEELRRFRRLREMDNRELEAYWVGKATRRNSDNVGEEGSNGH